jgi:hypothetical protein
MDSAKRSRIIIDTSTADLSAATTTAGGAQRQRHERATMTTTDQDHAHHHHDGTGVAALYPGKRDPGAPPPFVEQLRETPVAVRPVLVQAVGMLTLVAVRINGAGKGWAA